MIGGGVIGISTAYYLARQGARVLVLERGDLAEGASRGNAGMISPGHPPINGPGRVWQAIRSLGDPLRPLYIATRWDPALVRWLWAFARYCTDSHLEYAMAALAPLGLATPEIFESLVAQEDLDCDYRPSGYLEVCRTERGLASVRREARLIGRHGFETKELSAAALREREPVIRGDVAGGFEHADGSTVNPSRFVKELARAAENHGARIRTGVSVDRIEVSGDRVTGVRIRGDAARGRGEGSRGGETIEADTVVVATGSYSGDLLERLGVGLPIQPAKGYHEDRDPGEAGTPRLSLPCLLVERSVFCTPMDHFVRFAGTLEFSGLNHEIRPDRLEQLMRSASLYLDGVERAEALDVWVGLRPCTPDGLPAIGALPGFRGLYTATGHGMLGLTLGPVTGKLLAERILEGRTSLPIEPFDPGRFLG
ncbi:MAG: FAD-dependent oxidoreductase [Gemmatimonadota bacterium]